MEEPPHCGRIMPELLRVPYCLPSDLEYPRAREIKPASYRKEQPIKISGNEASFSSEKDYKIWKKRPKT